MTDDATLAWTELNDRYLQVALERVRLALELALGGGGGEAVELPEPEALLVGEAAERPLPSLAILCRTFDLSSFERDLLVLAAAPDLQQGFEGYLGGGEMARRAATLGLALTALPGVHWNALAPDAALRYWRLVEVGRGETLTASPLRVEERVLHFLRGLL